MEHVSIRYFGHLVRSTSLVLAHPFIENSTWCLLLHRKNPDSVTTCGYPQKDRDLEIKGHLQLTPSGVPALLLFDYRRFITDSLFAVYCMFNTVHASWAMRCRSEDTLEPARQSFLDPKMVQ